MRRRHKWFFIFLILLLNAIWAVPGFCQDPNALYKEGINKYNHAEFQGALQAWQKGLERAKANNHKQAIAVFSGNIGVVYKNLGDYPKALDYYEQALKIDRDIGDKKGEGADLSNIGIVYINLGDYPKALDYYEQALKIRRDIGDKKGEGADLTNIGIVYADLGDYPKALDYYEQALKIHRDIGDKKGEGADLTNIGNVYRNLGDYPKALDYYEQALKIDRDIGDKKGEGADLTNIGNVYTNLGDYPKALDYYEQALKIHRDIGDKKGEGADLSNIGLVYSNLGDYPKALDYYEQALKIAEDIGTKPDERRCAANIGDVYLVQGTYTEAESWYGRGGGRIRRGRLALAKKDYRKAVGLFEGSLKENEVGRNAAFLFADLMGLGLGHEGLKDYDKAKDYFQRAVDMLEQQREGLSEAQRAHFYESKIQGFPRILAYEGLARVLHHLNEPGESYLISEGAKARLLSEIFSKRGETGAFRIPDSIKSRETELVNRMAGYHKMMENLFKNKQRDRYREIEKDLEQAREELDGFVSRLRRDYPEYAAAKYPIPLKADQIALTSDEVPLSYQVTDQGTLWYLIRNGRVDHNGWIDISRENLNRLIREYRSTFEEVRGREDIARHDTGLSQKLHDLLLAEALKEIHPLEKIIIVPSGALGLLPFDALVMNTNPTQYVADQYDIAYAHSGTSLTLSRTLKRSQKASKPMFVLADPVFDQKDARLKSGIRVVQSNSLQLQLMRAAGPLDEKESPKKETLFSRLIETGRLAKDLKSVFGKQTDILTGLKASKKDLQNKSLDQYRHLVFATHGILDEDVAYIRQPALVLSQIPLKDPMDGFFTLTEVMSTRLNCDVAALTACRTGLGRTVSGEGVMHLGRGFQYAGAKSVLVSLWSVDEKSTTMLVEMFFAYLKKGEGPREALRQARKDVRHYKDGIYDHPFFWGAFILIGDYSSDNMGKKSKSPEELERLRKTFRQLRSDDQPDSTGARVPISEVDSRLRDYFHILFRLISANWVPPAKLSDSDDLEAIYVIRIDRKGQVVEAWFEKESGEPLFDRNAKMAVERCRFHPLPDAYAESYLEVALRFTPKGTGSTR